MWMLHSQCHGPPGFGWLLIVTCQQPYAIDPQWGLWNGRLNRCCLLLAVDSRQRSPSCLWKSVCSLFQWWCHCVLRWSSCRVQAQAVVQLRAQDGLDSHLAESSFKKIKTKPLWRHLFSKSLSTPFPFTLYFTFCLESLFCQMFSPYTCFSIHWAVVYTGTIWYQKKNRVQEKSCA